MAVLVVSIMFLDTFDTWNAVWKESSTRLFLDQPKIATLVGDDDSDREIVAVDSPCLPSSIVVDCKTKKYALSFDKPEK